MQRLLLLLTLVVVEVCLIRQLDALNRTLKHHHLQEEQTLKAHQQVLDEHQRRMERY